MLHHQLHLPHFHLLQQLPSSSLMELLFLLIFALLFSPLPNVHDKEYKNHQLYYFQMEQV
jgi:hypothetical protein